MGSSGVWCGVVGSSGVGCGYGCAVVRCGCCAVMRLWGGGGDKHLPFYMVYGWCSAEGPAAPLVLALPVGTEDNTNSSSVGQGWFHSNRLFLHYNTRKGQVGSGHSSCHISAVHMLSAVCLSVRIRPVTPSDGCGRPLQLVALLVVHVCFCLPLELAPHHALLCCVPHTRTLWLQVPSPLPALHQCHEQVLASRPLLLLAVWQAI